MSLEATASVAPRTSTVPTGLLAPAVIIACAVPSPASQELIWELLASIAPDTALSAIDREEKVLAAGISG